MRQASPVIEQPVVEQPVVGQPVIGPELTGRPAGGGRARGPAALLDLVAALRARRPGSLAVMLPLLLTTAQLVVAYVRLRLPARAVTRSGNLADGFHRLLYARLAYSDLYTEYAIHGLVHHPVPYRDVTIEYPVVTGAFMTLAALAHGVRAYFLVSSLGLWACALVITAILWGISHRAAWLFAACPLLALYALLNWDLLGIALMLLAWRSLGRRHYGRSAAWFSLAVFAKLFPAFLFGYCFVALLRRLRASEVARAEVARFLGVFAVVALALNGPFAALAPTRWGHFWLWNARRTDRSGLLYHLHVFADLPRSQANLVLLALVGGAFLLGVAFVARGTSELRAAAAVFAVFLLLTKVYSPQYVVWIAVLALLAEWPVWTFLLVSAGGVVDFFDWVVLLDFQAWHLGGERWIRDTVWPVGQGARLVTQVVGLLGATLSAPVRRLAERTAKLPGWLATRRV